MSDEANTSSDAASASGPGVEHQPDRALATPEFAAALEDADILLDYAAGNSQPKDAIPADVVRDIVLARLAWSQGHVSSDTAISFWLAYAKLSRLTKPVTGASARACRTASLRREKQWAVALVVIITAASIFLFMNNTTASDTSNLIEQQNAAALKLWSDLQVLRTTGAERDAEPAKGAATAVRTASDAAFANQVFESAVEFSRRSQALLQSANKLHSFNFWSKAKPPGTESDFLILPDVSDVAQIKEQGELQIRKYQSLRNYATELYKTDTIYGALTTYLLPTGYALLGAFLYGFRLSSRLIRRKCYLPSAALSARYYIAVIAGLVVGLFGSLAPSNLVPSPLAVAFLVGYAVEAFFSRLDDLIVKFKGDVPSVPQPAREEAGD